MAKITGFKEFKRQNFKRREVKDRVKDWKEIYFPWTEKQAGQQASRCMDCGVPFCNNGCPLGNLIPDWNDLVSKGDWKKLYHNCMQLIIFLNLLAGFAQLHAKLHVH